MLGTMLRGSKVYQRAAEIGLEPAGEVHRDRGRRDADVAEIAIARRNVHATAEGDRQVGIVAANAGAFVERLPSRLGRPSVLIAEGDVAMNVVADGLDSGPAGRRTGKKPGNVGEPVRLAVAAAQQEGDGVGGQVLHRVLGADVATTSGRPESHFTPSPFKRILPAGATMRLHQLPKASR